MYVDVHFVIGWTVIITIILKCVRVYIYLIRKRVRTTWERNNDSESEPTVTFDVPP